MMNKTRVSKAYCGNDHIGWKKNVAGQNWFLWYDTSPANEAKALAPAGMSVDGSRLFRHVAAFRPFP
jgi:hypothetical protein